MTNPIGRLVKDSAVTSGVAWNSYHDYDSLGRAADLWVNTWHSSYKYDLNGDLTNYSDSSFATYAQTFDAAGRLTAVTSTYPSGSPAPLASGISYFPTGQISKMTYGNNLTGTNVFNPRLQPCRINLNSTGTSLASCSSASPGGNLIDFSYGYGPPGNNNGNLISWSAVGLQTFSHTYSYDPLNRIVSMTGTGGACTALNWTYDTWGNRLNQTAPPGGGTCVQPQLTYLSSNRLSGYGYDSAGNLTSQSGATFSYDNESRLIATTGTGGNATYVYDASGRRISKTIGSATTSYSRDKDGNITAWLSAGGPELGYAYINGQILAQYENGTVYFHHRDHLGSMRLLTETNQSIEECLGYYPFGEFDANQCTSSVNNTFTTTRFAGKEWDSESNLDNFEARYLGSSLGRFMSPDIPSSLLLRAFSPQRWNQYTYALNNPISYSDPTGKDAVAVNFSHMVGLQGHEGLLIIDKSGLATFASFGPKNGVPGSLGGQGLISITTGNSDPTMALPTALPRVEFGDNGLPTPSSYAALVNALAQIEDVNPNTVRLNYFQTSEADTQTLRNWVADQKQQSDQGKGQFGSYNVCYNNCASFTIAGLFVGKALSEKQVSSLGFPQPNAMFQQLKPYSADIFELADLTLHRACVTTYGGPFGTITTCE